MFSYHKSSYSRIRSPNGRFSPYIPVCRRMFSARPSFFDSSKKKLKLTIPRLYIRIYTQNLFLSIPPLYLSLYVLYTYLAVVRVCTSIVKRTSPMYTSIYYCVSPFFLLFLHPVLFIIIIITVIMFFDRKLVYIICILERRKSNCFPAPRIQLFDVHVFV